MASGPSIASVGWTLGFGLAGLADGIVLHQILQWHHLASGTGRADLAWQTVVDGIFHATMWCVVVAGIFLLRRAPQGPGLGPAMLVGAGVFHLADGVLSHWVFGLHRAWPSGPGGPLAWDLAFFALGAALLVGGMGLARRRKRT